jgi:NADPH:quinone reductase-like Zn-dependent oxidoreductase
MFAGQTGYEAAGVVEAAGADVKSLVGQRIHITQLGTTWAEYVLFDTKNNPFYVVIPDYITYVPIYLFFII